MPRQDLCAASIITVNPEIQQSERELFPEVDGGAWITAEYPDLGKIRTDRILSGCGSSPEYYLVYLESMEICK